MLKPLVKRGQFLPLKRGFYPIKWGRWTLGEFDPLWINLPPKHVLGTESAQPILTGKAGGPFREPKKEKRKKHAWVEHFTPPQTTPFTYTFRFVYVGWGHRRNHPCQVSSQSVQQFRLPRGSKFTISHILGEWLLQQCYALTCLSRRGSLCWAAVSCTEL